MKITRLHLVALGTIAFTGALILAVTHSESPEIKEAERLVEISRNKQTSEKPKDGRSEEKKEVPVNVHLKFQAGFAE